MSLIMKVKKADITELMKKLQDLVGESIQIMIQIQIEDVYQHFIVILSNLDFELEIT